MKKITLSFLVIVISLCSFSQEKMKRVIIDFDLIPATINLNNTSINPKTLGYSLGYRFNSAVSLGVCSDYTYLLDNNSNTYGTTTSLGLCFGYRIFKGKESTKMEKSSVVFVLKAGDTWPTKNGNQDYLYFDAGFKFYYMDLVYTGIGYRQQYVGGELNYLSRLYVSIGVSLW